MTDLSYINFTNQDYAERMTPQDNMAMISIRSPRLEVLLRPGWKHLLILEFNDIDKKFHPWKLFDKNQAQQVIDFVESLPDEVDSLMVHCEAGISRSAAVALFIRDYYAPQLELKYAEFYNKHVRSLLEKVYHGVE